MLDWLDGTFDMILQSTMFTSILDPKMKRQVAAEMVRILKPDGFIVWYDFFVNNPQNSDVCGVPRREITALVPHCLINLRRVTLVPPLACSCTSVSIPLSLPEPISLPANPLPRLDPQGIDLGGFTSERTR